MCFKAQSSKLERLFALKRGKRNIRVLSFELSKISPQVGLAVLINECHWYDASLSLVLFVLEVVKPLFGLRLCHHDVLGCTRCSYHRELDELLCMKPWLEASSSSVLSQHAIREAHVSEHHQRSLCAAASLPRIEGSCLDTAGHLPSAQWYHKSSTLFHCELQPQTCCLQHCFDQLTVCEQTCCAAGNAAAGAHTEYSSVDCKYCCLCEDASRYQTSPSGVGPSGKVAEGLCSQQNSTVGKRCHLWARMYQTITSGPACKAAEGLCSWQSSAVGERCHLCINARMYQTITSSVMAGSAGEAAEGVVQPAKLQIWSASHSRRRAITSSSSIPCSRMTR